MSNEEKPVDLESHRLLKEAGKSLDGIMDMANEAAALGREDVLQEMLNVVEPLVKKINSEEIAKLKAQLWVAKDSQLRTYDGLTEKADKYDELVDELKKVIEKETK